MGGNNGGFTRMSRYDDPERGQNNNRGYLVSSPNQRPNYKSTFG